MRKICVVTGTRAEYGLLYWLMREIQAAGDLELQVVATGTHLVPRFGETVREIEADGFAIAGRVDMLLASDSAEGVGKSLGLGTIGFAETFARLRPDVVVLLGDRFETLAAAQAALVARIPVAHLHGGELTQGAFDDAIRHAVTKMASLHFVSYPVYRDRVIQLGEVPETVHEVGPACIDSLTREPLLGREDLEKKLGFPLVAPVGVVTYHPETLCSLSPDEQVRVLLGALEGFPWGTWVFTGSNADTGGTCIREQILAFCARHGEPCRFVESLGRRLYPALVAASDVVLGNSSSGIVEAPLLGTPTVNVGDRQKGRLRPPTVLDVPFDAGRIREALSFCLESAMKGQARRQREEACRRNPAAEMVRILRTWKPGGTKGFYDLPRGRD
ncbi:UDP-N-acetyl-D-glucosamine 2-epimerase, UDP-hydrolysing [Aminomonas paucivorans DSM 12260]|uniref:UDP-N-acetyl-D-glucosamine 2-epimerase, UDP-hydrolysing n=1 Tax=Aminomonas paucivorans DSM 12260 TaxID=584708 RepID=E3CVX6_9BACT|nr:UDP-N-acetylglucosamine 2-epimerase [Aminomonas paucivorans]EFQ24231.1 UDP-N-acetyl-D-glucosamine 2-epimerase, UDP-hydrolysing [Aminomonas paucivorans DSM 12260]